MKICAAQLAPEAGKVDQNTITHLALIDQAVALGANLIFFPELSLTSYEPTLAGELAFDADDTRLDIFQKRTEAHGITIGVGIPLRAAAGTHISMVLFRSRRERMVYSKQRLHADEQPFFAGGTEQAYIPQNGHVLAPAICYESLQQGHADTAASGGADIYLASVAKSARGVDAAYQHYPKIAQQHFAGVLMANAIGPCDTFVSAGRSAAWNGEGRLLASLDERTEGLVWMDTSDGSSGAVQRA